LKKKYISKKRITLKKAEISKKIYKKPPLLHAVWGGEGYFVFCSSKLIRKWDVDVRITPNPKANHAVTIG